MSSGHPTDVGNSSGVVAEYESPCANTVNVASFPGIAPGTPGQYSPLPGALSNSAACSMQGHAVAQLPLYKGFLFGLPITVLFDTGSSGLFLAEEFQRKHNLPVRSLGTPLDVKLADGSILRTDLALKYPAPVKIGSYRDKLPLRVVPLDSGFDVVLGMPWIAEVKPVIDWDSLEATISLPGQPASVLKPMLSEIPVTASIMSVRAFKRHIKRFGTDDVIAVYESLNSMADQDPRVAAILTSLGLLRLCCPHRARSAVESSQLT